jgi:hypothetical protein
MEKELQKIQYPRGTQDYSKSRMRENRKYGSVRGGQSNLIPSTRLPPQGETRNLEGLPLVYPTGMELGKALRIGPNFRRLVFNDISAICDFY